MRPEPRRWFWALPGSPLARLLAVLSVGLVAALSLTPRLILPEAAPDRTDLVLHWIMHMAMAFSLLYGWPGNRGTVCLLAVLLAGGLEVAQTDIPGRTFDWLDLAANVFGGATGLVCAWRITKC